MLPSFLLLRSLLLMLIPKFLEVPAIVGVPAVAIAYFCCWSPSWYCLSAVIAYLLLLASLLLRVRAVDRDPVVGVALL
jgi:hypothetical protein